MSIENFGRAITALGLENRLLYGEDFLDFSLKQRGKILGAVIGEKLELGRWESVIEIVYGAPNPLRNLFDGNREELKKRIFESAVKNPSWGDKDLLAKLGDDYIFKIAILPQISYEKFKEVIGLVGDSYFEDGEKGDERRRTLCKVRGEKALKEREWGTALDNFEEIDYQEGLEELFDAFMVETDGKKAGVSARIARALSDETQRQNALRKIVLESGADPLTKFKIYNNCDVSLTDKELQKLYRAVARKASSGSLDALNAGWELRLMWAERHARSDPKEAYGILRESERGYENAAKIRSVIAGLEREINSRSGGRGEGGSEVSEIEVTDLKEAYEKASFDVKAVIAKYLWREEGFGVKLRGLSEEAYKRGNSEEGDSKMEDFKQAYELWWGGVLIVNIWRI